MARLTRAARAVPRYRWWHRVRRQADTFYLMIAATITGGAGLASTAARSQAITATLPGWAQTMWYAGIMTGGLLGGAGVVVGRRLGLTMERPARWLLAGMCSAFGVAVFSAVGARGVIGVAFIGLFAAACLARSWEIRQELRHDDGETELRAELAAVQTELDAMRDAVRREDRR